MGVSLMRLVKADVSGVGGVVYSLTDGFDNTQERITLLDLLLETLGGSRELRVDELFLLSDKLDKRVCLCFKSLQFF